MGKQSKALAAATATTEPVATVDPGVAVVTPKDNPPTTSTSVVGTPVKLTSAGDPSIPVKHSNFFLDLAKNLALTYGTKGLGAVLDATVKAVTVAENITKPDGTNYSGAEKFSIALNMLKYDTVQIGKEIALDAAGSLIDLAVSSLFGKLQSSLGTTPAPSNTSTTSQG